MANTATTRAEIQEFLAQKRLAMVGVSRDSKSFANTLFRELKQRGYDIIPVNPHAETLEGERCFARVQDIAPTVDGALLMTAPASTDQVVRECAAAGIKRVWLYGVVGPGAADAEIIEFCKQQGMTVIPRFCPYMFLPETAFFHRAHGFVMQFMGMVPR